MFDTVLVANRGEIAVRVIQTLQAMGVHAIAVHSDADTGARHVREADAAVWIGPAAAAESYLSVERILEAAQRTGARAVHPGYGFLAENAEFARACIDAGLTFIGPSAEAIELMGDKIRAKETVRAAGVPVVSGSSGSGLTDAELAAIAREIGAPVLLKPSAGGGGKGMRLVRDISALEAEIAAARREAGGAFGDENLLVERWIEQPRHIEIQVLADHYGHVVHLGERECSLQRRHQKIVEEAPSPLLTEETRAAMGQAAVETARSCGYVGAGTVEFIVPGGNPDAYSFMEMNTRLQVEHPVTELATHITGVSELDLVEWQLRIAAGEPIPWPQEEITFRGHAVEARVCAESARVTTEGDSERVDFLPAAGTVLSLREPGGSGVRTDSGLDEGTEVGTLYDPMLAKVIAHGSDRSSALRSLRAALGHTTLLGVDSNIGFLRRLLAHPKVLAGDLDTGLVDHAAPSLVQREVPEMLYAAAALLSQAALEPVTEPGRWSSPFAAPSAWRLGGAPAWTTHHLRAPGRSPVSVRVRGPVAEAEVQVGDSAPVHAALLPGSGASPQRPGEAAEVRVCWNGVTHTLAHAAQEGGRWLGSEGDALLIQDFDPVAAALSSAASAHGADALTAPMPGTVTVAKAAVGDAVAAGQSLLVVEAMKMEHVITAPFDGTVAELPVVAGSTVAIDQILAVVEPLSSSGDEHGDDPTTGASLVTESAAASDDLQEQATTAGSGAAGPGDAEKNPHGSCERPAKEAEA